MKRIFLAMMMFVAVAVCVSCNGHDMNGDNSTNSDNGNNMVAGSETMELVEKGKHHEVWRDTKTGHEYFVRNGVTGVCGFQLTGRESE